MWKNRTQYRDYSLYNNVTSSDTEGEETDWDGEQEEIETYAPPKEAVIIFMDVDSFDVQVRGRNQGIPSHILQEVPYVVVNEQNIITALNYPAKAYGIKRSPECYLDEARKKCSNLKILEIPNHFGKPDSLETRRASDEIFDCIVRSLQKQCEGRRMPVLEKASKDEFYIDVSDEVFHRVHWKGMAVPKYNEVQALLDKCILETPSRRVSGDTMSYRTLKVLSDKKIAQQRHVTEALLMHGATIAHALLEDIKEETTFTLSAGISSNKLLAKIGCGQNKPDKITVLPHASLGRVSKSIQIKNIPGLGGKLGQEITEKLHVKTMSQLGQKNRTLLQMLMKGEDALRFHLLAVGQDPTKVVPKRFCDTLKCGITFNMQRRMFTPDDFQNHLWNRFLEIRDHLLYEYRRHGEKRIPKSFRVEVGTRKGREGKYAFKDTQDIDENLKAFIKRDNGDPFNTMDAPWGVLYEDFLDKMEANCKIDIFSQDGKIACAAVRKISEINLVANFAPVDDEDEG